MFNELIWKKWKRIRIRYQKTRRTVRVVPKTNNSIVMDIDGYFYVQNRYQGGWQCVRGGIFDLYRMLCHIELGYGQEVLTLEQLTEIMGDYNVKMVGMKVHSKLEDKMKGGLAIIAKRLERVRNEYKQKGYGQIVFCLPMRDSLKRFNIGVFQARTIAARNRFRERLGEIGSIEPWIAMRRSAVAGLLRTLSYLNKEALRRLETAHKYLNKKPSTRYQRAVQEAIEIAIGDIKQLRLTPFSNMSWTAATLTEVLSLMNNEDIDKARNQFQDCYWLFQKMYAREELEYRLRAINEMIHANNPQKQPLLRILARSHNQLGKIKGSDQAIMNCNEQQLSLGSAIKLLRDGRLDVVKLKKVKDHIKQVTSML